MQRMTTDQRFGHARRFAGLCLLASLLFCVACVPSPSTIDPGADTIADQAGGVDSSDPDLQLDSNDATLDKQDRGSEDASDQSVDEPDDGFLADLQADVAADTGPDLTLDMNDSSDGTDGSIVFIPAAGYLGSAPSGSFQLVTEFEVRNDTDSLRNAELARSAIPLTRTLDLKDLGRLAVVGPGDQHIQAQFNVISRYGGLSSGLAVRWLQVSLPVSLAPNATKTFQLRYYDVAVAKTHPSDVTIKPEGNKYLVDTGRIRVLLDPKHPALFETIALIDGQTERTVYTYSNGAGPRLARGGDILGTSTLGSAVTTLTVDKDKNGQELFQIYTSGPSQVVVMQKGHFIPKDGKTDCTVTTEFGDVSYHRFGYTVVATFTRNSGTIDLQFNFRNECGNAEQNPWHDQAADLDQLSWELPLTLGTPRVYYAGTGLWKQTVDGFFGTVVVEQRKGGDLDSWTQRLARITVNDNEVDSGNTFLYPSLALRDAQTIAMIQMPWMRFREPQALVSDSTTLSLRFVSAPIRLGEAKGLWNRALITLLDATPINQPSDLKSERNAGSLRLERGLLVRVPVDYLNSIETYLPLHPDSSSIPAQQIVTAMEHLHDTLVGIDQLGQWDRAKTFGAQIWPDIQLEWTWFFPEEYKNPLFNDPVINRGNPMDTELTEFLRTGDPKWVWEFALPQSWTLLYTALYNIGDRSHGFRNGFAVTFSGPGITINPDDSVSEKEGGWHRDDGSGEDYSPLFGLDKAYLLRPSPLFVERFRQAGLTVRNRYDLKKTQEHLRDPSFNPVNLEFGRLNHFQMLLNCAEFVPGSEGQACATRIQEIMAELARDNLLSGVPCSGDLKPAGSCETVSIGGVMAGLFPLILRYVSLFGDHDGLLMRSIGVTTGMFYQTNIPTKSGSIDLDADWWQAMTCTLNLTGDAVVSCVTTQTQNGEIYSGGKLATLAGLLVGNQYQKTPGLCTELKTLFGQSASYTIWQAVVIDSVGWTMRSADTFGLLPYILNPFETCSD